MIASKEIARLAELGEPVTFALLDDVVEQAGEGFSQSRTVKNIWESFLYGKGYKRISNKQVYQLVDLPIGETCSKCHDVILGEWHRDSCGKPKTPAEDIAKALGADLT